MQGVFDAYIADNKWLSNAEKAKTDEERIKFCKAYLSHKGIEADKPVASEKIFDKPNNPWSVPPVLTVNHSQAQELHCRKAVDYYYLRDRDPGQKLGIITQMKIDAVNEIGRMLVKGDFVKFNELDDYNTAQHFIQATVKVIK